MDRSAVVRGGPPRGTWSPHLRLLRRNAQGGKDHAKIRVLLVITGLASGGATNVVLDLARSFRDHPDFDVHLLTGPCPPGRTDVTHLAYDLGVETRVVPSLINRLQPLANLKAVADLRRIMVQGNYDIVHTHSSVAGVVGRLAARAARVPAVVHHVHGWALHEDMSRPMRVLYVALESLCARWTTRIVVVSRPDIAKGISHRIGKEDQYRLIYNGIDLEKFQQPVDDRQVRMELGVDPDCKLVGMIGRLDRQKNPLDFIRAAAMVTEICPQVQFLIAGDGPRRQECERLIEELALKGKVFLLGYRSDVARILPTLTITAMSSLWEGLPLAFLEAMSAGKPIVANDVDGAGDVVAHGTTGFLVEKRRPEQMAERIVCLLEDETLCGRMGRFARQRAVDFSVQRMAGQVEGLYRELHFAGRQVRSGIKEEGRSGPNLRRAAVAAVQEAPQQAVAEPVRHGTSSLWRSSS
ncbi:MAG: glycosyltransferase family 4 protein [Pirellulales bacterium]|nr:glycosyltransferase family 4 protein [Pirellulales bacterium]